MSFVLLSPILGSKKMPDARACCIVLFVKIRYVNLKTILDLRLVYSGDKQLAWVWHDNLVLFVKGMKRQKAFDN